VLAVYRAAAPRRPDAQVDERSQIIRPQGVCSDFDSYLPKMGLKAALCRWKTWI
jgi:hypothetical protein